MQADSFINCTDCLILKDASVENYVIMMLPYRAIAILLEWEALRGMAPVTPHFLHL